MTRNERYLADTEYRAKINKENRDRYHRNMLEPTRAKIHRVKARINNGRVALLNHEQRAAYFMRRIQHDIARLDRLVKQTST